MNYKKIIQFILGFVIIIFLISQVGIRNLVETLSKSNLWWIFLATLFFIFSIIIKITKWYYLSRKNKVEISFKDAFFISLPSFFFANVTPGRIGEAYKCLSMKRKYGLDYSKSLAMLFYDKFTELSAITLASILAIIIFPFLINTRLLLVGILVIILLILSFGAFKIKWLINKIERFLLKLPFLKNANLHKIKEELNENIKHNFKIKTIFWLYSFTSIAIILEGLRSWLIIKSFGFEVNLFEVILIICLATVLGILSALPLGLGVTETSMAVLYHLIGLSFSVATASIIIDRFITSWLITIIGIIFLKKSWQKKNQ